MSEARKQAAEIRTVTREIDRWDNLRGMLGGDTVDIAELFDTLDGETNLVEALDVIYQAYAEKIEMIDGIKARAAELDERRARVERSAETLREVITAAIHRSGAKTFRLPEATLTVSDIAGKTEIEDEAAIPARFWRRPDPVLDKKALTAALKAGEAIPGARQGDPQLSLTIRRK